MSGYFSRESTSELEAGKYF